MRNVPSTGEPPEKEPIRASPITIYARAAGAPPMELPSLSRRKSFAGLGVVLATLAASLILPLELDIIAQLVTGGRLSDTDVQVLLLVGKVLSASLALLCLGLLLQWHGLSGRSFGLDQRHLSRQLLWAVGTLVGIYAAFALSLVVVEFLLILFPGLQEDVLDRMRRFRELPITSPLYAAMLMLPVAIHEEVLFRGLMIPYLRRAGGSWVLAVGLSAGVFAVLHVDQGFLAIIQVMFIGVALGILFVVSRSLLAVILAHYAFDFIQLQLVRVLVPMARKLVESQG